MLARRGRREPHPLDALVNPIERDEFLQRHVNAILKIRELNGHL